MHLQNLHNQSSVRTAKPSFQGVLVSFAEAASYLVFSMEVAPLLPGPVFFPLLSAVLAVSLSHDQWSHYRVSG